MITLAIETSTPRGSAAIVVDDRIVAEENFERSNPQQHLFGAIRDVLKQVAIEVRNLNLIGVGVGPGSYTGIRGGIAAAKGLALPFNLPIKGVSSYDAIARELIEGSPVNSNERTRHSETVDKREHRLPVKSLASKSQFPSMPLDCQQLCVLGDARRDEIYYSLYERNGHSVSDCKLATIESLADEIHDPIWFLSSEIDKFKESICELLGGFSVVCEKPVFPSAGWIGRLGVTRFEQDQKQGDKKIEPVYLRPMQFKES